MTVRTLILFQLAYPEQTSIERYKGKDGIYIECLLLNEDKTPHMTLFDEGSFPNDKLVDDTIQKLLDYKI